MYLTGTTKSPEMVMPTTTLQDSLTSNILFATPMPFVNKGMFLFQGYKY